MHDPLLFANRYRIPSTRKPSWYYDKPGRYFITICTHDRVHWFGDVRHGMMGLSDIGSIVHQCWAEIPCHYPHVTSDAFIVMPDHVHGILVVGMGGEGETFASNVSTPPGTTTPSGITTSRGKPTPSGTTTPPGMTMAPPAGHTRFIPRRPPSGSVGSIINQFKSACTKRIWKTGITDFAWQPRFHDSIIRDDRALRNIRQYIIDNPSKWGIDG